MVIRVVRLVRVMMISFIRIIRVSEYQGFPNTKPQASVVFRKPLSSLVEL